MSLMNVLHKVREKGLARSCKLAFEGWIFSHWHIYLLERPLENRVLNIPQQPLAVTEADMHVFEKNYSSYLPSFRQFFRDGSHPVVYTDDEGNAIYVFWVHAGSDYFDREYYKTHIPVPHDCIYQFAAELAKDRRSRSGKLLLSANQRLWQEYLAKGFTRTRSMVNGNNQASVGYHLGGGFEETGLRLNVYRLFGRIVKTRWETYQTPVLQR